MPIILIAYTMLGKREGRLIFVVLLITYLFVMGLYYFDDATQVELSKLVEWSAVYITAKVVTVYFGSSMIELYEEAQEQLHLTQTRALTQEKLAEIGMVASGIAHELKNPVNIIDGSSQVIQQIVIKGEKEEFHRLAGLAKNNLEQTQRMSTIIGNVLSQVRSDKDTEEFVETDLAAVVARSVDIAQAAIQSKSDIAISIKTQFPAMSSKVKIQPVNFQRVVINLMENAFYELSQKCQLVDDFQPRINISLSLEKNHFVLRVRDNGRGIPLEHQQNIFKPFYTTKVQGQGTGLGLSIVRDIVTSHGGVLKVESDGQSYTEFQVFIPKE
jgi:two-component system NtrC family sensor kinase